MNEDRNVDAIETVSPEQMSGVQPNPSERGVFQIEPLTDSRWDQLLERHPRASVFHSRAWLEALRRTYGYEPIAYTTSSPGEPLRDAIAFCRVESWITGKRLVSLPFSDYCEPMVENGDGLRSFVHKLREELLTGHWNYIEIRPLKSLDTNFPFLHASVKYTFHQLDLKPDIPTLYHAFHKDSIQRKIRRAKREGLRYEEGATGPIVDSFYRLLTITRRRHGVPPQPKAWFRNLIECFGPSIRIGLAYHGRRPIAGMLTLRHKDTLVYKYGGSDARFNNLGGMHCLYWESIQRAKASGLQVFDLGRSDADQRGLIRFKSRWGATMSSLTYYRFAATKDPIHWFEPHDRSWRRRSAKGIVKHSPACVLPILGNLMYRHVG